MAEVSKNKKIKAVVFDLDGTLVDSRLDFSLMKKEIGMPPDTPILEYLETLEDPERKAKALNVVEGHEERGARLATEIFEAGRFVRELEKRGLPKGILTRNSLKIAQLTLERFNWKFDLVLSRDCAPPKPSPDGLVKMSRVFNVPLEAILYIGDHEFDLDTAINAGAKAGLVLNGKNTHLKHKADFAVKSFMELIDFI